MRKFLVAILFMFIACSSIALGLGVYGELKAALFEKLNADPSNTTARVYYNTVANTVKYYDSSAWRSLLYVVTSSDITDGTIVNADINASAAIAGTKIDAATSSTRGAINNQDSGSFTATFTQSGGYSQAKTVTWRRANSIVTLNFPSFVGSCTAAAVIAGTVTAGTSPPFPASLNIATAVIVRDNGATQANPGWFYVTSGSAFELDKSATTTTFTSGASCGLLQAVAVTYNLD